MAKNSSSRKSFRCSKRIAEKSIKKSKLAEHKGSASHVQRSIYIAIIYCTSLLYMNQI